MRIALLAIPAVSLLGLCVLTGGCGRESSSQEADADRSGNMETLPRPIEVIRERPDAWEEFADPVTDLRGFRVKPTGAEQRLSVKFKDVDDAVRTKAFIL